MKKITVGMTPYDVKFTVMGLSFLVSVDGTGLLLGLFSELMI